MKKIALVLGAGALAAALAHRARASASPIYLLVNGQRCSSATPTPPSPYGCGGQMLVILTLNSDGTVAWSQPW